MTAALGSEFRSSVVMSGPHGLGPVVARQTKREVEQVVSRALVSEMVEEGRGLLATTALQIAGSLSALEEHLTQVAPSGAHRYQAIADAQAIGAAQAVARWGR